MATEVSSPATALQLLLEFLATQEERSRLYAQLAEGFKRYIAPLPAGQGRSDVTYRLLMEQVTRGFADCSKKVLAVEASLNSGDVNRADLGAMIRRVQEGEREKLQVTVSLQALRTAIVLRADRRQMQEEELKRMMERKEQIAAASKLHGDALSTLDQAAHTAGHTCGHTDSQQPHACCGHHGHNHDHDMETDELGGGEEATEAECDAAIREALQRLDRCVGVINEALEEIRYEVADLRDSQ